MRGYAIDRQSRPREGVTSRKTLDAVGDLVGLGMVFPGAQDRSGDYYAVEIDAPTPEQLDDEELGIDDETEAELINE